MGKILTVSIAAYNVEKYLEKTLSSLLAEETVLRKMEVFIVNDGSSDGTLKIAEKYRDLYPEVFFIIDKENGGYGSTVNVSLERAEGKYFRLLDGDDEYITENIKGFIAFLESEEADIILTPYVQTDEKTGKEETKFTQQAESRGKRKIEEIRFEEVSAIQMHGLTVKTDLLKRNGMKIQENCFYTDLEFVFKSTLYADTIAEWGRAIYKYRVGVEGQSVSTARRMELYKDNEKVLMEALEEYQRKKEILSDRKKELLLEEIRAGTEFCRDTLLFFPPDAESRMRLKSFEKKIRDVCPELYEKTGRTRKIFRLLRLTDYRIMGLAHRRIMKENDI